MTGPATETTPGGLPEPTRWLDGRLSAIAQDVWPRATVVWGRAMGWRLYRPGYEPLGLGKDPFGSYAEAQNALRALIRSARGAAPRAPGTLERGADESPADSA